MGHVGRPGRGDDNRGRTETLEFESPTDHIVLVTRDGRRLLLDTGSPASLGGGTFELFGDVYPLRGLRRGFDLERVGRLIGTRLDGLLGTDVLGRVPFAIDWDARTVVFGDAALATAGASVPMTTLLGVPRVRCEVAGRSVDALVDTGAAISFLARPWEGLADADGIRHEFFLGPDGLVVFDSPLRRLRMVVGESLGATFGDLPEPLARALLAAGVEAIVGAALWKRFRVAFDVEGQRLVVG